MIHLSRRELIAASIIAALAPALPLRAATDDARLAHVHPELRSIARYYLENSGYMEPLGAATLPEWRTMMTRAASKPLDGIAFERKVIPGLSGQPEVAIYIINGKAGQSRPGILHTHGGGFVLGKVTDFILNLQEIAQQLDCGIVSVDYLLAPETTFAGSIEDNYAGLKWLHDHGSEIGVDPKRLGLLGESAGGGHAALLALTARDRGEIPVAFQSLIYPMLDDRTGTTRKPSPPIGEFVWASESNAFGWEAFLGRKPGGRDVPERAVPSRARSLAGLPPTFIGVGSIDLFVDEDIDYARRLIDAGVPTELHVVPGAFHGFDSAAPQSSIAKAFTQAKIEALRRGLSAM